MNGLLFMGPDRAQFLFNYKVNVFQKLFINFILVKVILLNLFLFCPVVNKIVFLILFSKSICRRFPCVACLQMKHGCIWAREGFVVVLMFFCGLFRVFSHKIIVYAFSSLIKTVNHSFTGLHAS